MARLVVGGWCQMPGADPEEWFPSEADLTRQVARSLCRGCPVQLACLERALRLESPYTYGKRAAHGVVAGLTPSERRTLIRQRSALTPADRSAVTMRAAEALLNLPTAPDRKESQEDGEAA